MLDKQTTGSSELDLQLIKQKPVKDVSQGQS